MFGKLKTNGSGGGICTWVDILIPLLTPCIVTAQTVKTRNTFNAAGTAPINSANMMRATKVGRETPQARNAALIAKRARRIPLQLLGTPRPFVLNFSLTICKGGYWIKVPEANSQKEVLYVMQKIHSLKARYIFSCCLGICVCVKVYFTLQIV